MVKALITRRVGRTSAFSAIVELVAGTCRLREPYMSMVVCMYDIEAVEARGGASGGGP